jgi:class 3 adenylate cyclase/predicted ATPase
LKIVDKTTLSPDAAASAPPAAAKMDMAERRQVTVMFSDLVGSTALSARMDPEDLREVISAYQRCVAETVQRFGGFVAKFMGDGVLIYFGYPQAHEDDAERAVRAGLELVAAVSGLKTHAALQTRVGIATGLVVVGDLIGSGASQEQAIVGETPNVAARLQGIAEPNCVVIAETTRKLVGNLFELEDVGARNLKGIAGPVGAWVALRTSSVESRFEAFHATGLTELVGREEELELLLRRWSKAKTGEGQVVLLSGEPGIGKSRLTAALLERLANEPHTRLRYFCSPQHTDSALFPIISQMERAAGFAHEDNAQTKLDKLDALLTQSTTSRQDAALFTEMLSLLNDGRYPSLELAAQQKRQKTLEGLTAQLETLAHAKPVLMIFEDMHWVDPTSLEVLGRTVDRLKTLRVLLIVTYRPEFEPPWIGSPFVTALNINRLGDREIAAMIDSVTGNKLLSGSIRQDIIERTDGIPLFIEEMTKAVLEAGGEEAAQQAVSAIPTPSLAVPASLHASLMARLDRLGPAKEVAQIGAAIGREFSQAVLAAVARKPEAEIQSAFDRLIKAGLLFRQGVPTNATYLFKHALVQDAAYGTLLREPRRALHARIARTLEDQFAEVAENQAELLARHWTEAGLNEKAVVQWEKAAHRSLEKSAYVEAAEQLTQALTLITKLPTTPASRRKEIKFQVELIAPLYHVKGPAAQETKAAVDRAHLLIEQAEALGEPPEDPLLLLSVLLSFWVTKYAAFDGIAMCELAEQCLAIAKKRQTTPALVVGHRMMGLSLMCTGDVVGGRAHLDQAIELYNPVEERPLVNRFPTDARVVSLSVRSVALWLLGYPNAARKDNNHALEYAREIRHAGSLMTALVYASLVDVQRGDYAAAKAEVEELAALSGEKGVAIWKAAALVLQGYILALMGDDASEATRVVTSAIAAMQSTGATMWLPLHLAYLSKAKAELCQVDDARRDLGEAMSVIETTEEKWFAAEVYRRAGEVALLRPMPDQAKAQAYFDHALKVSRTQQAKSLELRAAMSLARLWRDQGKVQQACELLAPVYGWFTEGFDTRDLKEAKALLEELAA